MKTGSRQGADRRVLFIASQPFFQWRGSPIRLEYDVRALAEQGWTVDFLTLPIGERREIPGVRIVRAPNLFFVRNIPIGPSPVKLAFDAVLLVMALGMAWRRRYRVVHGVEDAGMVAGVVRVLCRTKLVFEKHSDPASHQAGALKNLMLKAYAVVERWVIRCADAVVVTGPGLGDQVRAVRPDVPTHVISDIPSSLAEPTAGQTAARRRVLDPSSTEVLATYVGSFAVYQGIDLMFEAMVPALARSPRLRFVIIGGTPEEIAERTAWLESRGLAGRVTFVGKVPPDELPDYLAASDILLSPRISGVNTPLKLLDYLKVGRAIVATDVPANRLILTDATALLVEPQPQALGEAIGRLAEDPRRRGVLGDGGRRLIETTYNFGEFSRRLGACYSALTEETGHV